MRVKVLLVRELGRPCGRTYWLERKNYSKYKKRRSHQISFIFSVSV